VLVLLVFLGRCSRKDGRKRQCDALVSVFDLWWEWFLRLVWLRLGKEKGVMETETVRHAAQVELASPPRPRHLHLARPGTGRSWSRWSR
jgi:hypothetical protein